ncbi:MAG: nucleotide sugar dehydrogenase [Thermoanaerobaculia bacterium]|nr:nucleotide sugar dehydrogenase [Thermoanaerobaculia bacterium]
MASTPRQTLTEGLESRTSVVGVLGLGYVGLPLALTFVEADYTVLGFDIDEEKVDRINRGSSYLSHLDQDRVSRAVESGSLGATADFDRVEEPDALLICVPTPLTPQREPELKYVLHTVRSVAEALRPGQLVVLESTTYPGTTEELVLPALESSGLRCGTEFFLAYSPEREDPGNRSYRTRDIPKVIGGIDEVSGELAVRLYEGVVQSTVLLGSARAAEATKLTENIFRAVNIALVNELKVVYDRLGIDVWEVLDAASTKPFGFMRFEPGPGWGGHCVPLDPFYLSWKAREFGVSARFVELAGEVNWQVRRHVLRKLQEALNERGKPLRGSRILILGLAYKRDVADPRESPSFHFIDELRSRGAEVLYHDPLIPEAPSMRSWPDLPPMESVPLTPELLEELDAVLLLTDHSSVDYEMVSRHAPLIVDSRGVYRGEGENVVGA